MSRCLSIVAAMISCIGNWTAPWSTFSTLLARLLANQRSILFVASSWKAIASIPPQASVASLISKSVSATHSASRASSAYRRISSAPGPQLVTPPFNLEPPFSYRGSTPSASPLPQPASNIRDAAHSDSALRASGPCSRPLEEPHHGIIAQHPTPCATA